MEEMADISYPVDCATTTFAKDFTELDPPAQVQFVDHEMVLPDKESNVLHCEPDVAADSPQRS